MELVIGPSQGQQDVTSSNSGLEGPVFIDDPLHTGCWNTGASGGTSKVGKRRDRGLEDVVGGAKPSRAREESTFPRRSPDARDR